MKHLFILALSALLLGACAQNNTEDMNKESFSMSQEWDKTFPLSEKVNHEKMTFKTQYGFTLVADLYIPKNANGKMKAIAVSGPFGAIKEQC
ncbi:MAG: alpha/beta hydrolase, partial [Bacteroidales bacterium]|nr:alpha/beta hydrolase [Bacteroidales bacterium]